MSHSNRIRELLHQEYPVSANFLFGKPNPSTSCTIMDPIQCTLYQVSVISLFEKMADSPISEPNDDRKPELPSIDQQEYKKRGQLGKIGSLTGMLTQSLEIKQCHSCQGVGSKPCVVCLSTGKVGCRTCRGLGTTVHRRSKKTEPCRKCNGQEKLPCNMCKGISRMRCRSCDGHGTLRCYTKLSKTRFEHLESSYLCIAQDPQFPTLSLEKVNFGKFAARVSADRIGEWKSQGSVQFQSDEPIPPLKNSVQQIQNKISLSFEKMDLMAQQVAISSLQILKYPCVYDGQVFWAITLQTQDGQEKLLHVENYPVQISNEILKYVKTGVGAMAISAGTIFFMYWLKMFKK